MRYELDAMIVKADTVDLPHTHVFKKRVLFISTTQRIIDYKNNGIFTPGMAGTLDDMDEEVPFRLMVGIEPLM